MALALPRRKLDKLKGILLSYKRVLVAYSGGVDSSFLLKCCSDFLGNNNVLAVTAVSPTYTQEELQIAEEIAQGLAVTHKIIPT